MAEFQFPSSGLELRDTSCHELLSTEQTYVHQMEILIQLFHEPLIKSSKQPNPLLSNNEISAIFSNVTILVQFNKELLRSMYKRFAEWGENATIGDVMIAIVPYLKCYTMYCHRYDQGRKTLQNARSKKPRLNDFLESTSNKPACKRLTLESFLIQPVQRVPRYVLLLQEILKNTPEDHPDVPLLTDAIKQVKEIATLINQRIKEQEFKEKILLLQKMIICDSQSPDATIQSSAQVGWQKRNAVSSTEAPDTIIPEKLDIALNIASAPSSGSSDISRTSNNSMNSLSPMHKQLLARHGPNEKSNNSLAGLFTPRTKKITLVAPHRRLVLDNSPTFAYIQGTTGRVAVATFFLFNDIIVWASAKRGSATKGHVKNGTLKGYSKFIFRGYFDLGTCWVNNLPNIIHIKASMLQLVSPDETLTFLCPSEEAKVSWLLSLSECIRDLITRRPHLVELRGPIRICEEPVTFTPEPRFQGDNYLINTTKLEVDPELAKKSLPQYVRAVAYCPDLLRESFEDDSGSSDDDLDIYECVQDVFNDRFGMNRFRYIDENDNEDDDFAYPWIQHDISSFGYNGMLKHDDPAPESFNRNAYRKSFVKTDSGFLLSKAPPPPPPPSSPAPEDVPPDNSTLYFAVLEHIFQERPSMEVLSMLRPPWWVEPEPEPEPEPESEPESHRNVGAESNLNGSRSKGTDSSPGSGKKPKFARLRRKKPDSNKVKTPTNNRKSVFGFRHKNLVKTPPQTVETTSSNNDESTSEPSSNTAPVISVTKPKPLNAPKPRSSLMTSRSKISRYTKAGPPGLLKGRKGSNARKRTRKDSPLRQTHLLQVTTDDMSGGSSVSMRRQDMSVRVKKSKSKIKKSRKSRHSTMAVRLLNRSAD